MKNKFILLLALVATQFTTIHGWSLWEWVTQAADTVAAAADTVAAGVVSAADTVAAGVTSAYNTVAAGVTSAATAVAAPIEGVIMGPIDALMDAAAINNVTTNTTPPAIPTSPPTTCASTGSAENPYYTAVGCGSKTTVNCLLASANQSLSAGGLPIVGLRVTGIEENGKWPVIGQTYIKNSSGLYVNNSCLNGTPYSPNNNMSGLLTGNSCGTLTPFYTYIAKCLEEGKIDTPSTGYGRAYNNKVFFNNAGATLNDQTVNPIQCMACGTSGTISSCTVFNDDNNPYPACAAQTTAPEMPPQYTGSCVDCD